MKVIKSTSTDGWEKTLDIFIRAHDMSDKKSPEPIKTLVRTIVSKARIEAYKDGYINGGIDQSNNEFFVEDKI